MVMKITAMTPLTREKPGDWKETVEGEGGQVVKALPLEDAPDRSGLCISTTFLFPKLPRLMATCSRPVRLFR